MTKDIKEVLHIAFDKAGGCDYLVRQAEENPKAFMALLARCIPAQVEQIIDMRPVTVEADTVEQPENTKPLIVNDKSI